MSELSNMCMMEWSEWKYKSIEEMCRRSEYLIFFGGSVYYSNFTKEALICIFDYLLQRNLVTYEQLEKIMQGGSSLHKK